MIPKFNFVLLYLFGFSCRTSAWTTASLPIRAAARNDGFFSASRCFQTNDDASDDLASQNRQEMMLEEMSLKGADRIREMDVPERAKRALLAETVEDRIFELTEVLEGFVDDNGMIPEENREKAVEIAQEAKSLKIQYNNLVTGQPSTILSTLDNSSSDD